MNKTLKSIEQIASSYEHDYSHSQQVARVAAMLFDACRELHGLSADESDLLIYAALLHDIGWIDGQQRHHKRSYELIMQDPPRGLSPREVKIIANVARYHRKSLPKSSHTGFHALKPHDRNLVRKLASLLRIADGLDVTHSDAVQGVAYIGKGHKAMIEISSRVDCGNELSAALKKSDLFNETFETEVDIRQSK